MRALTAEDVLGVWERAQGRSATRSALLSLAAIFPDLDERTLAGLSLGDRDTLLLRLRRLTFGTAMECRVECPQCGEPLEFTLDTNQLGVSDGEGPATVDDDPDGESEAEGQGSRRRHFERDGLELRLRPLDSTDLLAAEALAEADARARELGRRALVFARRGGENIDFDGLDDDELAWFETCLGEIDPAAERRLNLRCPDCDHAWGPPFDVAAYFEAELGFEAERLLGQVHTLARFYGWAEHHILAMSARRRHAYLERIAD